MHTRGPTRKTSQSTRRWLRASVAFGVVMGLVYAGAVLLRGAPPWSAVRYGALYALILALAYRPATVLGDRFDGHARNNLLSKVDQVIGFSRPVAGRGDEVATSWRWT